MKRTKPKEVNCAACKGTGFQISKRSSNQGSPVAKYSPRVAQTVLANGGR
jgi:hypothetical protein